MTQFLILGQSSKQLAEIERWETFLMWVRAIPVSPFCTKNEHHSHMYLKMLFRTNDARSDQKKMLLDVQYVI